MIQNKLNELGKLMDKNPTSTEVLILATEIKNACSTHEEEKLVEDFVGARLPKLTADVDRLYDDAIKFQLEEVGDMLNLSYIAKTYFKKSRAWLSQRVNGNNVNGRPCRFTQEELNTFNFALRDMSAKLSNLNVSY